MISMVNAFHGKTFGTLTATDSDLFRRPFQPLVSDFVHIDYGDSSAVKQEFDADTTAVIIEPNDYIPELRSYVIKIMCY
ncbi:MAG: Acetylornithine/succinyldiaminopimelate aminotransferase [Firmicutes bacterium]|nr:Acetylornithine/succinyldiaminopimelate aminotransferase [Bacillota bacterium]